MAQMDREASRDFFLMPIPPTPNGRAHLGHIAGPYLRMDVLGRHLKLWGHRVMSVSATDGFDSYVLWKAQQERRSPEEVCRDYHRHIRRDFLALDIEMRAFLDVVQGETADLHAERARRAVEELLLKGATIEVEERVLYSRDTGRYIVGAWLEGQCPRCFSSASGYFCEACGAHFKPEAMIDPEPRLGDSSLESRTVTSLYLKLPELQRLLDHNAAAGVPPEFLDIVGRYLETEGPAFRLTAPGTWGVSWPADKWGNPRVLFESGWEYALTCGGLWSDTMGRAAHPMRKGAGVTTVVSFGIDNTACLLVGCTGVMMSLEGCKPFDQFLTNHFFNLQGSKFSTSRGHLVWAGDIVENTPATSDAVRYFLAKVSPEHRSENFDIDEFVRVNNEFLVGQLQALIFAGIEAMGAAKRSSQPPEMLGLMKREIIDQRKAFRASAFSMQKAAESVNGWIVRQRNESFASPADAYWWIKGLAFLSAPLMPRLSVALWWVLGHEGVPNVEDLLEETTPRKWQGERPFREISLESLSPCLPQTVSTTRRRQGIGR